jgi:hypothetical protein
VFVQRDAAVARARRDGDGRDPGALMRRLLAARRLAVDPTLDPARHEIVVTAAERAAWDLYVLHGVRV